MMATALRDLTPTATEHPLPWHAKGIYQPSKHDYVWELRDAWDRPVGIVCDTAAAAYDIRQLVFYADQMRTRVIAGEYAYAQLSAEWVGKSVARLGVER